MKFFIFLFFSLTLSQLSLAQRRNIPLSQSDNRFTIRAESGNIGFGNEYYYFYVKNNTNQTYQIVVNITVYSPCFETKNYKLGINRVVYLEPGEEFTPSDDYYHIFTGDDSKKACRIKVKENVYTYISQIGYTYSEIRNITQEEAEKEREKAAKEKERLEKEAKEKEEKEKARLEREAQIKEAEEKNRLEREAKEKEAAQERQQKEEESINQDQSGQNPNQQKNGVKDNGYRDSNNNRNNPIPYDPAQDKLPDLVRTTDGGYFQRGSDGRFIEIDQDEFNRQKIKEEQVRLNTKQEAENLVEAQQEAYKRQQQKFYEDFQAQMEQNRIDQQNLEAAGVAAADQIASGNYQQAGITYGTELAKQGYGEAALVSLGVGTAAQIISAGIKQKRQKEEAEARRLENERIRLQREREKEELLKRQKIQFDNLVAAQRAAKKNIIASRVNFFGKEEKYTNTFDKFSQTGEPIYIFFVEAKNEYKNYTERVSFPNQIDIQIVENVHLNFSPILKIYPNSSGEYPFLTSIVEKIKKEFVQENGTTYKIFDWSPTLEGAQERYKTISQEAINSKFIPIFPEIMLDDFAKKQEENDRYWPNDPKNTITTQDSISEQVIDYWNLSRKSINISSAKGNTEKIDYWKKQEAKDSLSIPKTAGDKIDYWKPKKD